MSVGRKLVRVLERGIGLGIDASRGALREAGNILDEIPKAADRLGEKIESALHEATDGAGSDDMPESGKGVGDPDESPFSAEDYDQAYREILASKPCEKEPRGKHYFYPDTGYEGMQYDDRLKQGIVLTKPRKGWKCCSHCGAETSMF